ncbi:Late secretory pathway protein AVL9 [Neofusicoccum parvum]|uniref:Late secretory pathway protein AVL9 n=1 Tax=Neofusicoccum parvum TaxID=310453 RepID=A0ACB5RZZ4_9PEZI|nr:Late secretory pathway protein AVL9 [Neofusicoccum parvum]
MAARPPFPPIVCIVDFHHARGPEVETWLGVEHGSDPSAENDWPLLPFMALSDGAHAATEDFSYFTLRHEQTADSPATSLFGISCTRQLDADKLINRPADVTRSTVQKAVVVISDSPQHFGHLREKLSVVTKAWFAQRDFTDLDILQRFQESLAKTFKDRENERDQFFGLSLREIVHEFKHQTLVLFKCCLLQPKLDEDVITISSPSLRTALGLSTPDRRWIDFLTQQVNDTWDENNPGRPNTLGYAGSEEFIRLQFEEYLLALLSTTKYRLYREAQRDNPKGPVIDEIDGDPSAEFNNDFIHSWMRTENFRIFSQYTDEHLFDIVVPEHPCSGGLTMDDVQRRLNAQVEALHLDERFAQGKETFNKHFAEGQKKVSTAFNNIWNDIEAMREAQRKKAEEDKRVAAEKAATDEKDARNSPAASVSDKGTTRSERASAYLSSWGQWASEKRAGWRRSAGSEKSPTSPGPLSPPIESKLSLASPTENKISTDETDKKSLEETQIKTLDGGYKNGLPGGGAKDVNVGGTAAPTVSPDKNDRKSDKDDESQEAKEEREKTEIDEEVERAREAWGGA